MVSGCEKNNPVESTCSYSLSSTAQSAGAEGGASSINVTRTAGSCGWTAQSDASWITVSNASGGDTAALGYSVGANAATDSRTGRITVSWTGGSAQLTVTQAGAALTSTGCTYSINPVGVTSPAAGSSGQSTVTVTGNNCSWSAQSNQGWIHITSGASGTGTGTIAYTVDANSGGERFGRIIVTHTTGTTDIGFTQNGLVPCTASLNPTTQAAGSSGGSFSTAFTTAAECAWTAASDSSWLTISSATSGTGNATISYAVAANTGAARTGRVTVTAGSASAQLTVNQAVTSCALPGTPGFLGWTTAGLAAGSVTLTWGAATGTVTSYVIEVGTTVGGTEVAVIDTGNTATSYTLTGLTTGSNLYRVRVRARNSCGVSAPSNEANPSVA
jgi:Putative binding domain, N-terminal/Fibronectin type III domain/Viral BACON domain